MKNLDSRGLRSIDWMTFSLYLSLVGVGWLMIFTVGYGEGYTSNFIEFLTETPVGKQTIWIGLSMLSLFLIRFIDQNFWSTFAYLIYGLSMIMLVVVLFLGVKIKGATSWFYFGGFSIQPSEFAKFATCLALGSYLSTYNTDLRTVRSQVTSFALFLLPMGLILLQPDAGSALIFLSFLIVLFREGLSANFYIVITSVATLFILGFVFDPFTVIFGLMIVGALIFILNLRNSKAYWLAGLTLLMAGSVLTVSQGFILITFLIIAAVLLVLAYLNYQQRKPRLAYLLLSALILGSVFIYSANYAFNNFLSSHQQDRINVWLRPELCDPQGSLYNVLQSKMAIASGGIQGKGFLKGTLTKLNYVPEQATDFIFCTIGEEQGFIGSFAIIMLFLLLILRITLLAERQRSPFARHYAYGLAGVLFFHFLINIGMTMGLLPIIGIPLPFISKGGSSLLGFTIMIGVLIKLDSNRFSS